jgi:hypothetical protein
MPFRFVCCFCTLLASVALHAQPGPAPVMTLDELQPGMKGEVWTVFQGTQPEPFHVEVTGVVRNALGPGKSLILCQLTDERVQKMGAVAGMSGSPLYINGRLAGALSYQVQKFETVRYAGFTPVADLIEVSRKSDQTIANQAGTTHGSLARRTSDSALGDALQPLTPVFTFGGLAPQVLDWLAPQFSALGMRVTGLGGQMTAAASTLAETRPLQPGDAVAVAVTSGDITLAATGTVSYVEGDRVVAFGHPMMGLGEVDLPMARAEIVAILPSNLNSLKVANTGAIIGTINQDRLSAVAGELGPVPAMMPVEIEIARPGETTQTLRFTAARHPQLTPLVIGAGAAQAVMGSNEAGLTNGVRIQADFVFPNGESVPTFRLLSGPQGIAQGLNDFVRDITAVLQNPYESTFPSGIKVKVSPLSANPTATLESVQLSRSVLAPGQALEVTIGWRDYQGAPAQETIAIPVSADWQGKTLEVVVANGVTLDQLTGRANNITSAQLRSFSALLDVVRQYREPDGLYVAVVEGTRLFIDQASSTRELPGSFERIARQSDDTRYLTRAALAPLWETRRLDGRIVTTTVRRPFRVAD